MELMWWSRDGPADAFSVIVDNIWEVTESLRFSLVKSFAKCSRRAPVNFTHSLFYPVFDAPDVRNATLCEIGNQANGKATLASILRDAAPADAEALDPGSLHALS